MNSEHQHFSPLIEGSPSDVALRLAPCPPAGIGVAFLGEGFTPASPLTTPDAKPHRMGMGFRAAASCSIYAEPDRAPGADGVSQGGGGAINSPKTKQALMPPEDMEPSAPGALSGV